MPASPSAIARHRLIDRFVEADAVRPDAAIAYEPDRSLDRRALERLLDRGVIRAAGDGRYYLDLRAYHAFHAALLKRAGALTAASLAVAIVVALLAALGLVR